MLEDVPPAIKSLQKVKVLKVESGSTDDNVGFESDISFLPFVNYLKARTTDQADTRSRFYSYLVERFETEPALLKPVKDASLLNSNRDLLELLSVSLFPVVTEPDQNIFALGV